MVIYARNVVINEWNTTYQKIGKALEHKDDHNIDKFIKKIRQSDLSDVDDAQTDSNIERTISLLNTENPDTTNIVKNPNLVDINRLTDMIAGVDKKENLSRGSTAT